MTVPDCFQEHLKCMELCVFSYEPQIDYKLPDRLGVTRYFKENPEIKVPSFFVADNNEIKETYVVIRGTRNANDLVADLHCKGDIFMGSPSHRGFIESGKNVLNIVENERLLENARINNYKIYFTGHSLGGAAAAVAVLVYLEKNPGANVKCVTFGSPPLLNKSIGEKYSNIIDSIINIADPIPFFCLRNLSMEYKTNIDLIYALGKGIRKEDDPYPLSFMDCKRSSSTSSSYETLYPPGRIFAIGLTNKGQISCEPLHNLNYFEGIHPWLSASCHRYNVYASFYDKLKSSSSRVKKFSSKMPPGFAVKLV